MADNVSLNQGDFQIWAAPHRVLFPASYLCAVYAIACWPLAAFFDFTLPSRLDPGLWHVHEMLFGFGGAALGGYLLTALPSWTGGGPLIYGAPLKILMSLWGLGRLSAIFADHLWPWLMIGTSIGFFLFLAVLLLQPLLAARAYAKLGFAAFPLVLGFLQLWLLRSILSGDPWLAMEYGHLALLCFLGLIILIGGRAVPAFTRNALALDGDDAPVRNDIAPRATAIFIWALLTLVTFLQWQEPQAALQLLLGLALLWSMRHWQTCRALRSMLLIGLHFAYLWLPTGLLLLGGTGLAAQFSDLEMPPLRDLLHGLSIGAMSLMIMAISGRAAARHPDGRMQATGGFCIGFAMVWLSAALRLLAGFVPDHGEGLIYLSAGAWCLGWLIFLWGFLPALRGPVQRPILSGKRYESP
ncbi:hypothetical protein RSK20926_06092 [Roseobacter sp. SK209-2-6]|uniref:NnrS family protein n=1 Tax=Roseobacter sp. SK209-2-6 TaxID=388739 RepID=UPI0000F3D84D|nr:NnrS family protein [Roseobacter sp. SK209-2-6]EBA17283.1 hypothetical protein RSK20926_06092 [Roseobacter sp. SK209-2-6]